MVNSDFRFSPDATWIFGHYTWDGEDTSCGYCGDLDYCLDLATNWILDIEPDGRTPEDVRDECLRNGEASGESWEIHLDPDFIEEEGNLEGGCDV